MAALRDGDDAPRGFEARDEGSEAAPGVRESGDEDQGGRVGGTGFRDGETEGRTDFKGSRRKDHC